MRTPADLYIPRHRLPPARIAALRDTLFDKVRVALAEPGMPTAYRLAVLSASVLPLAQILLGMGTAPGVVVGHAAELLEAVFLADALADAPELLQWFAE